MSVMSQGLHPSPGAVVYTDPLTQMERIALVTPEEEAIRFLLDGLGVGSIGELHAFVEAGRAKLGNPDDDPGMILRWIEAGFPPWGCHNCRGAERGPDGVPCPACGGDSESIEPPERAAKIRARFDDQALALWFTPQCIRDHFEGDENADAVWVAAATDEQLAGVGADALQADYLYSAFHDVLVEAVREADDEPRA